MLTELDARPGPIWDTLGKASGVGAFFVSVPPGIGSISERENEGKQQQKRGTQRKRNQVKAATGVQPKRNRKRGFDGTCVVHSGTSVAQNTGTHDHVVVSLERCRLLVFTRCNYCCLLVSCLFALAGQTSCPVETLFEYLGRSENASRATFSAAARRGNSFLFYRETNPPA